MNAGRIRFDYLERLQSSMTRFEKELLAAITMVTDSLKAALHAPRDRAKQQIASVGLLDSLIRDCALIERNPVYSSDSEVPRGAPVMPAASTESSRLSWQSHPAVSRVTTSITAPREDRSTC